MRKQAKHICLAARTAVSGGLHNTFGPPKARTAQPAGWHKLSKGVGHGAATCPQPSCVTWQMHTGLHAYPQM